MSSQQTLEAPAADVEKSLKGIDPLARGKILAFDKLLRSLDNEEIHELEKMFGVRLEKAIRKGINWVSDTVKALLGKGEAEIDKVQSVIDQAGKNPKGTRDRIREKLATVFPSLKTP